MPAGRPSAIDQIVGERDGAPITAADRIIDVLSIGGYFEEAAASAGVHRETAYGWLRIGAKAHAARARNPKAKLTAHELRCMEFSDAKARAEAEWEARCLGELERLARGGRQVRTETVKEDGNGQVLERTVRTETLPPNARVLMWRLERRYPDRYAGRVEVTGAGGEPLMSPEERAEALAGAAQEFLGSVTPIGEAKAKRARKAIAKKAPAKKQASAR